MPGLREDCFIFTAIFFHHVPIAVTTSNIMSNVNYTESMEIKSVFNELKTYNEVAPILQVTKHQFRQET